jgi:alpha-maltose-1-phosphate synthase
VSAGPHILHLVATFDEHEAHGATISSIARHLPGTHRVLCARAATGAAALHGLDELGGDPQRFGARDAGRLATAIDRADPDVVHFHGGPIGAATSVRGWGWVRPTVATLLGWPKVQPAALRSGVPLRQLVRTRVLSPLTITNTVTPTGTAAAALRHGGIRALITPDAALARRLDRRGLPIRRYVGVTPPRVGLPTPAACRFVFAGRAEPTRGPDVLAAAATLLRVWGHELRVDYLFLPGPALEQMQRFTDPADRVETDAIDLAAELRHATAVVLPFRFDETTLSPALVAAEALAAGVPVIGTDVRCLRSLVRHGTDGFIVASDDSTALAEAMERLILDPTLGQRMGAAGHAGTLRRWQQDGLADAADWAYRTAIRPTSTSTRSAP